MRVLRQQQVLLRRRRFDAFDAFAFIRFVLTSNHAPSTIFVIVHRSIAAQHSYLDTMAAVATAPSESAPASGGVGPSDAPKQRLSSSDFIRTATQNYISRSASVLGAANLTTKGKSIIHADATIRGDYGAPIHIGRYCHIEEGVVVVPSVVPSSNDPLLARPRSGVDAGDSPPEKGEMALPVIIGSHTRIGKNTRVQSVSIGSCVRIGANCVLSPRSKVHDCCVIEDGTVIPPDMVIPPFSRVRGNNPGGKLVGTLPECCGGEFVEGCVQDYLQFVRSLE